MYCIETTNLGYYYTNKEEMVLKDINLKIPENAIYGFLGINGSGKSTAMKLILGLLKNKMGEIKVFGQSPETDRTAILKNIGAMIESPVMYGHLSAKENLQILQKIYKCPVSRIDEVLEIVSLSNTGNKKSSKFSLGMKQRLGIAQALLHSPKLLILDEPTNGLDVNGILEIRELLLRLREQGVTVMISSHQLPEIEKVITHIGIISRGVLSFQGTMEDLTDYAAKTLAAEVVLETNNVDRTAGELSGRNIKYTVKNKQFTVEGINKEDVYGLASQLNDAGIKVYGFGSKPIDLETMFKQITNN